jgi:hypothetical protein
MRHALIATARRAPWLALLVFAALAWCIVAGTPRTPSAQALGPSGDYRRVILVSWDGVRRDVLFDLLEVSDPTTPCWEKAAVFPVPTGRLDAQGRPHYTCLPALAGAIPADVPATSPAYAPFQVLASHTTNDGNTMTKPQHASMLTGLNAETHGLPTNLSKGAVQPGVTIYEMLMNAFDPVSALGRRDGKLFRTLQASSKKYVGKAIYRWAAPSGALQIATSSGNDSGMRPGPLRKAEMSFARWKQEEIDLGLRETAFFVFLHFKSPDWAGHRSGPGSSAYRRTVVESDRKVYTLLELLRNYRWDDTAIFVTTDHGFHRGHHTRDGGRHVFNTWLAAYNVHLSVNHVPLRTQQDYCASHVDPASCRANGPEEPMPPADVVPNVLVTAVTPTLLDMFGVEWRTTTGIEGVSLYNP